MTHLVNQLIRQARATPRPDELTIKPSDVAALANHARLCEVREPQDVIEEKIMAGSLRFLGVPVRVLGQKVAA